MARAMGDHWGVSTTPTAPAQAAAQPPARRGMSGTAKSMVISMVVLLGGCLMLFALVPRVNSVQPASANAVSIARSVGAQQKWNVALAPALPKDWTATNVTLIPGSLPRTWQAGYTAPGDHYAAVKQTRNGDKGWVAQQTGRSTTVGTALIGGVNWTKYKRSDGGALSLVRSTPLAGLTTVVVGTGDWAQVELFARAVRPLN